MILIGLLAAAIISMVGLSTYYQSNFFNVSRSFEEKASELDAVTEHLQLEKSKLNETTYQLTVKQSREKDLSKISEDLTIQKNVLETDKSRLQTELAQKSQALVTSQQDLNKALIDVSDLKSDKDSLEKKVKTLTDRSNNYKSQKEEACDAITGDKPSFC